MLLTMEWSWPKLKLITNTWTAMTVFLSKERLTESMITLLTWAEREWTTDFLPVAFMESGICLMIMTTVNVILK